jgi:putative membrane protein
MTIYWIAIAVGIVFLVRYLVRHGRSLAGEDSALEILRRRYAKGEISKEEYEERRIDLSQSSTGDHS